MRTYLRNFWKEQEGQDLIEYTLLLAFVALVAAGLFIQAGTAIRFAAGGSLGQGRLLSNVRKDASEAW